VGCCGCDTVDDGSGGGGGGSGALAAFTYTCTGAEGSDFFIPFPAALSTDDYIPSVTKGGGSQQELYDVKMPDDDAADRTTLQFRVITAADVLEGDKLDVIVIQRI
jgi:hypothetical protein